MCPKNGGQYRGSYGVPILIYRLSTVYVPCIYRISTVVNSGGIGFFDKLVERNIESPTRKREKS